MKYAKLIDPGQPIKQPGGLPEQRRRNQKLASEKRETIVGLSNYSKTLEYMLVSIWLAPSPDVGQLGEPNLWAVHSMMIQNLLNFSTLRRIAYKHTQTALRGWKPENCALSPFDDLNLAARRSDIDFHLNATVSFWI